jgi:ankyrin repeat protein
VKVFAKTLFGGLDKASRLQLANSTNRQGDSLLHAAVTLGADALIPLLLMMGADSNHRNKVGKTPLMEALEMETDASVEALLADKKLDPKAYQKTGTTLL